MSQETSPSIGTMVLTFLAGATVGAVAVALTTRKTGVERCADLRNLASDAKRKIGNISNDAVEAWDDAKERSVHAASDLKRGVTDAVKDLQG